MYYVLKRICIGKREENTRLCKKNRNDCHDALESIQIVSNENENMLLSNDKSSSVVIFSTKKNLTYLTSCKTLFMDGTFSYCPKFFMQMFTLHTVDNGNYVPLIFSLLPDKKSETYTKLFRQLLVLCQDIGVEFSPEYVVVDFEQAIHNAVQDVWPTAKLKGRLMLFLYFNS